MSQIVQAASVVHAQPDFFLSGSRVNGIVFDDLISTVFVNDAVIGWSLADGTSVADSTIQAGTVYFNEIADAPGFYALRFWTDRVGFWRVLLEHDTAGESSIEVSAIAATQVPQILYASVV